MSDADAAKLWNKCTIAQLKAELCRRDLDTAGKKADLVNRLVQSDADTVEEDEEEEVMEEEEESPGDNEEVTNDGGDEEAAAEEVNNGDENMEEPADDVTDAEETALLGITEGEPEADPADESTTEKMDTEKEEVAAPAKPKVAVATKPKAKTAVVKKVTPVAKKTGVTKKVEVKKTVVKKSEEKKPVAKKTEEKKTPAKKTDEKKSDADKDKKDAKTAPTPQRHVFVPDKRQMRMDMLCDNDLKTVCVFPISTADMMRPELAELYTKCLSISTTFYNGKDEDGKLVEQGYIKFHFVKFSDADTVLKTLADTLKGVTVSGQYDAEDFFDFNQLQRKKPAAKEIEGAPSKKRKLDESATEKKESDETEGKDEEVAAEEETKPAEEEEKADEVTVVSDRCNEAWFKHILAFPHPRSQLDGVLCISNVPESATEQALLELFTDAKGVFIARGDDVDRKPKGYPCVDYGKMQGAFDAMDKMTDNAELDGQQLVVHSFMPKPDECIPADESTEIDVVIDSVSGVMPTKFKDMLVKRIRELRNELIIAQKEHNNEVMTTLDKRIINIRQRLSKDNRLRSQLKWKTLGTWRGRGSEHYRPRGGYRGRWNSSYQGSSSYDRTPNWKRPRDESWSSGRGYSSNRYPRGGRDYSYNSRGSSHSSYGRQSGDNDPMNLLAGLNEILSNQLQNQSAMRRSSRYETSSSDSRGYRGEQEYSQRERYSSSESRWPRHY